MHLAVRNLLMCWWLASSLPIVAQSVETGVLDQIWPELNTFVTLNSNARLFFLTSGTRTRETGYSDGQLGVHIDLFAKPILEGRVERHPDVPRNRFLMVRAGYLFGKSPSDSPDPFTEHMPTLEGTPRFYLPGKLLVSNRSRIDFRFLNGDFTPRYRNRLKVERSYPVRRFTITPYAHAEAFYDWRYDVFHRFRFSAGAEWEINKHLVLEGYYLRQQDSRSSVRSLDVGGIVVQFFLP